MTPFFKPVVKTFKNWHAPVIGVLIILPVIYLFSIRETAHFSLLLIFSLSFLCSGILEIFLSVQNRKELRGWGWYLANGILSISVGVLLIENPITADIVLPLFVGFSLLFRSVQGLGFAFELKHHGTRNRDSLTLVSILGFFLSFFIIANPVFTEMSQKVITALPLILAGTSVILAALQLKKRMSLPGRIGRSLKSRIDGIRDAYYKSLGE